MTKLSEIIAFLEKRFPPEYAEDFDNIGLLAGRAEKNVSKALICLDCTLAVVEEAARIGAELIITHHPFIFNAIKSVNDHSNLGRAIVLALENNISIYSAHTNLDSAPGGLTDYLVSKLSLTPISSIEGNLGRVCTVESVLTAKTLCDKIKKELGIKTLFSTFTKDRAITKVAVCNGGGGGELAEIVKDMCDVYISGDLKYHEVLSFAESDVDYIEISHYDSEFIVTMLLKTELDKNFPALETQISQSNTQPLIDTDKIV